MHDAVLVENLVKAYRNNAPPAVGGLSFDVKYGEVFGLLGPNGAGKTTTVGVLTTRVLPTSGRALVDGVDVVGDSRSARQRLAVVPQRNNLDRSLSIRQNLLFHAAYHGVGHAERIQRADELLQRMGLAEQAGSRIDWLSGGQAQRIMIARALMHRPVVMFLDEPTTGLDPQARLFVHDRIAELRGDGVTVVLTTHDMDEAEKLCDTVGIIDRGTLLALDSPAVLMSSLVGSTTLSIAIAGGGADPDQLTQALSGIDGVERVEIVGASPAMAMHGGMGTMSMPSGMGGGAFPMPGGMGGPPSGEPVDPSRPRFRLYISDDASHVLQPLLKVLGTLGSELSDLSIGTPSLEDVFIHLTGRELR